MGPIQKERKEKLMADYVIRNIDDQIYEAFRIKAIKEHKTIRQILIEFMTLYAQDKVKTGKKN
jgi:plasmid stability protein